MAKNISIDRTKRLREEPHTGHNRWHPDIPPVIEVAPGEEVTLETRDAVDLQIGPRTTVKDLEWEITLGALLSVPSLSMLSGDSQEDTHRTGSLSQRAGENGAFRHETDVIAEGILRIKHRLSPRSRADGSFNLPTRGN